VSRTERTERTEPLVVVLAGVGVVLALLPLVPLVVWSFSGRWAYPALLPQQTSTRGLGLLTDPRSQIGHGLLLSVGIGAVVAGLACVIGLPAGRAIGLYRFRGRRLVQFLLLGPVIVPGLAVTLGLQVLFIRFGLSGTVPGVVLVQLVPTVPYAATVLGAAFANLDVDYERQARALGAGPVRTTWAVTLPLLRPAIVVAGLFGFLISWSEYVLTLLVGAGQVQTLPLLLFAAIGSSDTTAAASLALLVVGPPLLLVALCARVLTGRSGASIGLGRL
jgi:putative spermidine/putrescine transport system permease protein